MGRFLELFWTQVGPHLKQWLGKRLAKQALLQMWRWTGSKKAVLEQGQVGREKLGLLVRQIEGR
jgi:hypothetical protein